MSEKTSGVISRYGRVLWGASALVLLLALVASLVLSGSSVAAAEREAQARAQDMTSSVIATELNADLLSRKIGGTASLALTVRIQAGILSDDRVEVVRIWAVDGSLIYSTSERYDVSEVVVTGDPVLERAFMGQTVSVASGTAMHHEDLLRPSEDLFQTFVPIRLSAGGGVEGVVEIDQRYAAIREQGLKAWRRVQVAVTLTLVVVAILLARAIRDHRARHAARSLDGRTAAGDARSSRSADRAIDEAHDGDAAAAIDEAHDGDAAAATVEAEDHLHELERRLREAESSSPKLISQIEELDLKLRASEAEREQHVAMLRQLEGVLAERDAELELARAGSDGTKGDTKRINKLIAEAEDRAAAAERKAVEAEKKKQEAAKRATRAAERAFEMEALLREAEARAADAEKEKHAGSGSQPADTRRRRTEPEPKVAEAGKVAAKGQRRAPRAPERATSAARHREAVERKHAAALKKTEAERDRLLTNLEDSERQLAELRDRLAHAEKRAEAVTEVRLPDPEVRVVNGQSRQADAEPKLADALGTLSELEEARRQLDEWGREHPVVPPGSEPDEIELGEDGLSLRETLSRAAARRRGLT